MRSQVFSMRKAYVSLLFLLQAICLIAVAPFQGDGAHDGIVLAPSIAIAEGLNIHKDAFSLYGPLNNWIYGFVLKFLPNEVFSLRITAALLSLITSWMLYKILLRTNMASNSIWISSTWAIGNAVYMTSFPASPLPWSSITANLCVLFGVWRIIDGQVTEKKWNFVVAGFFFGLSIFARIQFITLLPLFLIIALRSQVREKKLFLTRISLGFTLGTFVILIILYLQGALWDYIDQSIIFPLFSFPSLGFANAYNIYLFSLVVTIPILIWILALAILRLVEKVNLISTVVSVSVILLAMMYLGKVLIASANLPLVPRVAIGEIFDRSGLWLIYSAGLVAIYMFLVQVRSIVTNRNVLNPIEIALMGGSLSALLQIYPFPDVQHLWWAAPLLIPMFSFIELGKYEKPIHILFISTIISSVICLVLYVNQPWVEFKNSVFRNIYGTKTKVELYEVYLPIEKFPAKRSYRFYCEDAIHSVATGEYSSIDEWMVNWNDLKLTGKVKSNPELVFICDATYKAVNEYALNSKGTLLYFDEKTNESGRRSLAIIRPKIGIQENG